MWFLCCVWILWVEVVVCICMCLSCFGRVFCSMFFCGSWRWWLYISFLRYGFLWCISGLIWWRMCWFGSMSVLLFVGCLFLCCFIWRVIVMVSVVVLWMCGFGWILRFWFVIWGLLWRFWFELFIILWRRGCC